MLTIDFQGLKTEKRWRWRQRKVIFSLWNWKEDTAAICFNSVTLLLASLDVITLHLRVQKRRRASFNSALPMAEWKVSWLTTISLGSWTLPSFLKFHPPPPTIRRDHLSCQCNNREAFYLHHLCLFIVSFHTSSSASFMDSFDSETHPSFIDTITVFQHALAKPSNAMKR